MVSRYKKIVIVGPTASGKTSLAIQVAKSRRGEIICADSRTIYKYMDIGTAKPSKEDQQFVKHHLLDILEPNQSFSAGEFKKLAIDKIKTITTDKHIPIVVGGSGLYVYGLIYDYKFPAGADNSLRRELNNLNVKELQERLKQLNVDLYTKIDIKNPRRLIRAIETYDQPQKKNNDLPRDILLIGLFPGFKELEKNIIKRTDKMFEQGLIAETKYLRDNYGLVEPLNTTGYKETADYLEDKITIAELKELIVLHTLQLAKRQMTWFKRNKDIVWLDNTNEAVNYINRNIEL